MQSDAAAEKVSSQNRRKNIEFSCHFRVKMVSGFCMMILLVIFQIYDGVKNQYLVETITASSGIVINLVLM